MGITSIRTNITSAGAIKIHIAFLSFNNLSMESPLTAMERPLLEQSVSFLPCSAAAFHRLSFIELSRDLSGSLYQPGPYSAQTFSS